VADDILTWLDSTLTDSQFQWEYLKTLAQEDPDGWGQLFSCSLREADSVSGCGILLTGADSSSKLSAAIPMLKLLDREDYECVFLEGSGLAELGAARAKAALDGLMDRLYDQGRGLCLVLEGAEEIPCRRELMTFLGQKLCKYHMFREELTPLFLILLDDREQTLPALLRSRLQLCRITLPDLDRRMAYLAQHAKGLKKTLSLELFAKETEGVTYTQLQDLILLAGVLVDSQDCVYLPDEDLSAFLATQLPQRQQEDAMADLCRSLRQLTEKLPQLLKHSAVNAPAEMSVFSPTAIPPKPTGVPTETEILQMHPADLAVDLMGEEGLRDLQQAAVRLLQ